MHSLVIAILNMHQFLAYRVTLKSPTLSLDEGAYDLDDEDHTHQPSEWDYAPDKSELCFTTDIRELFAEYFVEHFANYEKFIIMPKQNYIQWQKNREQFQNFDKTAYLSDQPLNSQAFYSAFLETSIFTIFVDDKIVAVYQPEKCKPSLCMFDLHIERHLDKSGLAKPPSTPGYRTTSKCGWVGGMGGREGGRECNCFDLVFCCHCDLLVT